MRTRSTLALLLAIGLALPACAARSQRPGNSAAVASAQPAQPRCADRVDRAKTGGMVGSVLGTIAASLFGTPALGIAYQGAGYVMGFASGSPCAKAALHAETPSKVQVEPVPVSQITEEDI
ncbi:MAG: hypothetical protein HYV05_08555 [Deltaproteobacteria bacterium]|nr:hypothetical protein [Deltaproteobacteria bacterium]MBI2348689.1 hypothetical protein [Deltaproteobacteria bacterium]MBI2991145.1 hypothetical protein [Deltaproteobacteria bacterium]MBI3061784.1 hypothetical protein [Deltaproteobacteria bacterium]